MTRQQIAQQINENTPVVMRFATFLIAFSIVFGAGFAANGWMTDVKKGASDGTAAAILAKANGEEIRIMRIEFTSAISQLSDDVNDIKELLAKNLKDDGKL